VSALSVPTDSGVPDSADDFDGDLPSRVGSNDCRAPTLDGNALIVTSGPGKTDTAFRTIGELSRETGLPQHILRYWETRFSQLRPLQRAGNRRYYRAEDAVLVRRIDTLLNREGYTVRGVQQLLAAEKTTSVAPDTSDPTIPALRAIRALLAQALVEDGRHT
jgi:DNA-binding transcriptional MerR regulator